MTANVPTQAISSIGPQRYLVKMNYDSATVLAAPQADGTEFLVADNLNLGQTISISVLTASGQQTWQITSPGGFLRFTWLGGFYGVG